MTPFFSLILGVLLTLTLVAMKSRFTGFRSQRPADLAARGPRFDLRTHLSDRIKLDEEAGGHVLNVTDWMYLMENGTIMNRSQFTKFGITVAELVATMRRLPA